MGKRIKVLIVEDSEDDARLMVMELEKAGYEVEFRRVESGAEVARALESEEWDAVLSDYSLPGFNGREAMKILRERDEDLPFIVVSGTIGEEVAVEMMRSGAQDYFLKTRLRLLVPAIEREIRDAKARRERKQALEQLRFSDAAFRSIQESVIATDNEFKITHWNEVSERMYQVKASEAIGKNLFDIIEIPESYPGENRERIEHLEKQGHAEEELIHRTESRELWVSIKVQELLKDNRREGWVALATDITQRRRAEEALIQSEVKYRSLVESMQDGIAILDADDNFVYINPAGESIFDSSRERIIDRSLAEYMSPEEYSKVKRHWNEQSENETKTYEAEIIRSGGKSRKLLVSCQVKTSVEGTFNGIFCIFKDISEYRQLEDQLRQSQKMEAVGRLAGGIAHDFNNMLTVISGNVSLAKMSIHEDDPLNYELEQIKKASERAARLTGQLLAFSRRQQLQPRVLDLNLLVTEMEKMLERVIGEDIELETILSDDLWRVKVDPGHFEQIILNLCINARDAMPEGGRLSIETSNVELSEEYCRIHTYARPGVYVLLTVSDTGCGMNRETQSKIFDPFFTTKAEGEGTGLGLSTVYGILKQSDGFVNVYSEPKEGSTFKVYLPRSEDTAEIPVHETVSDVNAKPGESVMIVEDEDDVRSIAVRSLKRFGYKVFEAENGGMAYLMCEKMEKPVDLLITDVIMPQMNGAELNAKIRECWSDFKVLYLSGYTFNVVAKKGIIDSETAFLQKPFEPIALARKVREVLDN